MSVESARHLARVVCYAVVLFQLMYVAWALELPGGNGAKRALRLVIWPTLFLIVVLALVALLRAVGVEIVDLILLPLIVMMACLRSLRKWLKTHEF